MAFSFDLEGTPERVRVALAHEASANQQLPQPFVDVIDGQLALLPEGASVKMAVAGKTGWGQAQTRGKISLSMNIEVLAVAHPEG